MRKKRKCVDVERELEKCVVIFGSKKCRFWLLSRFSSFSSPRLLARIPYRQSANSTFTLFMADKVRDTHQYLHQKAKYLGLGDADTSREQFLTNVLRDTLAAVAMHDSLLSYNSLATNTHRELLRQQTIKKMVQPLRREK